MLVEETGEIHEKAVRVSVPHYVVENLTRGVKYSMVVTAVWTESGVGSRDLAIFVIQVAEPTVANVTDNTIKISWPADEFENTEVRIIPLMNV